MTSAFDDPDAAWRAAENAWRAWLRASDHVVIYLGGAVGNAARTDAPLVDIGERSVRAPDLMTTTGGVTTYWEVKYRTRSQIDSSTGIREHWMPYEALQDYVALADATEARVWIVLYEEATSTSAPRWLKSDVHELVEVGREDARQGRGADEILAWVWPVTSMDVVPGPRIDPPVGEPPVLTDEGPLPPLDTETLRPVERRLRRAHSRRTGPEPIAEVGPAPDDPVSRALGADPVAGLDVLRRTLGIPSLPRYSVMRIGGRGCDLDEVIGLLDYGIRVFLITGPDEHGGVEGRGLQAFADARLLQWAALETEPDTGQWVVDGRFADGINLELQSVLDAADDTAQLNMGQFRIVHAPPGQDILVTAGAGTGKTETMAERVLFLLSTASSASDEGSKPRDLALGEIALVTFTRDAAREIRARLTRTLALRRRLCGRSIQPLAWLLQVGRADISTIHAFARRVVQSAGGPLGLSPGFSLSPQTMELRAIVRDAISPRLVDLLERHGSDAVPPAHAWVTHITTIWDTLGNNGIDILNIAEDQLESMGDVWWGSDDLVPRQHDFTQVVREVLLETSERMRDHCSAEDVLPTSALMPAAIAAIRSASAANLVDELRFLFVDEFQDTDPLQLQLMLEVRQQADLRLFIVGDAKQGIYRWRGAEGNAFEELRTRAREMKLPDPAAEGITWNFRTGGALLESLHPFFAAWGDHDLLSYGRGDELRPARIGLTSSPVSFRTVNRWARVEQVAEWAAEEVLARREQDPRSSIAVLCRRNRQAFQVQQAIQRLGGQCELRTGGAFFDTPAVREMRALLEAVTNPDDDAALLELAQTRWAGGIVAGARPPAMPAGDHDTWAGRLPQLLAWPDRLGSLPADGSFRRDDLDGLRARVRSLRHLAERMPALEWVVECAATFAPEGCAHPGERDDQSNRRRYARCLDHLVTLMDETFVQSAVTLERLLGWLRLQIATQPPEEEPFETADLEAATTALTVHKAKGLEFDRVLIPWSWDSFTDHSWVTTEATILRISGPPQLAWTWRPPRHPESSNLTTSEQVLWSREAEEIAREEARLLYVAMTRARQELRVFTAGGGSPASQDTWQDLLAMGEALA